MTAHLIPHFFLFLRAQIGNFPPFFALSSRAGKGGREGTDTQKQNNGAGVTFLSPRPKLESFCAWQCDESGGGVHAREGGGGGHTFKSPLPPPPSTSYSFFVFCFFHGWGRKDPFALKRQKTHS